MSPGLWLHLVFLLLPGWFISTSFAAPVQQGATTGFSDQESLRGSVTPQRAWWDLKHYQLSVAVDPDSKSITGTNTIRFETLNRGQTMQIDLQQPLEITKVLHASGELKISRQTNVYLIEFGDPLPQGLTDEITIHYRGQPLESSNPPWSGGFSWQKDDRGNHFIATSCQGIGASVWWPCKDHGDDEPDDGMHISITVPQELVAVSNGRLGKTERDETNRTRTFHWTVTQPINNYGVSLNVGNYVSFSETYEGEFGTLDLEYWVLEHQREIARKHFREVPRTIAALEHWFGKYPFYEDSYKLVVVPYPGMEHQSSVSYGNGFKNGYRGIDLSATGVGLKFDFIIVHESAHEWFGNSISMKDAADMWIHESFANHAESLFVEYHFSREQAEDYVIGCRQRIKNDRPIIGQYNLNRPGSADMYDKGGNMLHMMRHIVNDDEKWRQVLRGLGKTFWHRTVTTRQVESYISQQAGFDFGKVFDQYLRTTDIPLLKYSIEGKKITCHLERVVDGFEIPVLARVNRKPLAMTLGGEPQSIELPVDIETFELDRNFYIEVEAAK